MLQGAAHGKQEDIMFVKTPDTSSRTVDPSEYHPSGASVVSPASVYADVAEDSDGAFK
jgi:hypothetical protein